MKYGFPLISIAVILSCHAASAKTLNMPSADIADVIKIARTHLAAEHIDVSHRLLASVEYKNFNSEYERPYWLLIWVLGESGANFYVRIYNDGKIETSCSDPRLCPLQPGGV